MKLKPKKLPIPNEKKITYTQNEKTVYELDLKTIAKKIDTYQKKRDIIPDELKIFALTLYAAGYTYKEIENITGITASTTYNIINNITDNSLYTSNNNSILKLIKDSLKFKFVNITSKALGLASERMEDCSFSQLMMGAGIAIDKAIALEKLEKGIDDSYISINIDLRKHEDNEKRLRQQIDELNDQIIEAEVVKDGDESSGNDECIGGAQ